MIVSGGGGEGSTGPAAAEVRREPRDGTGPACGRSHGPLRRPCLLRPSLVPVAPSPSPLPPLLDSLLCLGCRAYRTLHNPVYVQRHTLWQTVGIYLPVNIRTRATPTASLASLTTSYPHRIPCFLGRKLPLPHPLLP